MSILARNNVEPELVKYENREVEGIRFNGAVIWEKITPYDIECSLEGEGAEDRYNCNCSESRGGWSDNCDCDCNCESVEYSYYYTLTLTFRNVHKLPIRYISASGASVTLEQTALTGGGTTYTYTSSPERIGGESFRNADALEAVKSLYPFAGVSGYSRISSVRTTYKDNGMMASYTHSDNAPSDEETAPSDRSYS